MSQNNNEGTSARADKAIHRGLGKREPRHVMRTELEQINERLDRVEHVNRRTQQGVPHDHRRERDQPKHNVKYLKEINKGDIEEVENSKRSVMSFQ